MCRTNKHKALVRSQLSKFNTVAIKRNDPTRTRLGRHPHTTRHDVHDRTKAQGSKQKTGCTNVHKAPVRSQLSKFDTAALKRNDPTQTRLGKHPQPKRLDPTRTC